MSLAREINQKLDEISAIKGEMEEMRNDLSGDSGLTNVETGDTMTVDDAMLVAEGVLGRIYDDLNKLTNKGQNVRDLFNNTFYINDLSQDKKCANELNAPKLQTKSDEIKTKHQGENNKIKDLNTKEIKDTRCDHRKAGFDSMNMTKEEFIKKWRKFIKDKDKDKDWLN